MMSRCFNWFPFCRRTLFIPRFVGYYKNWVGCGVCLTVKN